MMAARYPQPITDVPTAQEQEARLASQLLASPFKLVSDLLPS